MRPRQFIIVKWCVYGTATLLFILLQICLLRFIRLGGVTPFLYPVPAAVVPAYERRGGGIVFALALGAGCDLALPAPFPGFFTIIFTLAGLVNAAMAEYLLAPGLLCGLAATGITFLLTALGRLLFYLAAGQSAVEVMDVAVREFLVTLPLLPAVVRVYRGIYARGAEDY